MEHEDGGRSTGRRAPRLRCWISTTRCSTLILFWHAFPALFPNKVGALAINRIKVGGVLVWDWPTDEMLGRAPTTPTSSTGWLCGAPDQAVPNQHITPGTSGLVPAVGQLDRAKRNADSPAIESPDPGLDRRLTRWEDMGIRSHPGRDWTIHGS